MREFFWFFLYLKLSLTHITGLKRDETRVSVASNDLKWWQSWEQFCPTAERAVRVHFPKVTGTSREPAIKALRQLMNTPPLAFWEWFLVHVVVLWSSFNVWCVLLLLWKGSISGFSLTLTIFNLIWIFLHSKESACLGWINLDKQQFILLSNFIL